MKIGFLIDDFLRDVKTQVSFVNDIYLTDTKIDLYNPEQDIDLPYNEYAYDIFGKAVQFDDVVYDILDFFIRDKSENKYVFTERCFNKAIPSTLFFLSKTGLPISNIEFYESYEELVKNFDVIITTNQIIIDKYKNICNFIYYQGDNDEMEGITSIKNLEDINGDIFTKDLILNDYDK